MASGCFGDEAARDCSVYTARHEVGGIVVTVGSNVSMADGEWGTPGVV